MTVERGPLSEEGVIGLKVIAFAMNGSSTLLGTDTPVKLSLNPNGGQALGQIIPAKSFASMSIPFMDLQIGPFGHFLQQPVDLFATITGIPPYGDKFTYEGQGNDIQDNEVSGPDGVRGTLDRLNITIKPPTKKYSIHALKIDADTGEPIPGWGITVYGGDCDDDFAPVIDSGFTDSDGFIDFFGLQAGTYSVEESFQPDWNPVTPFCVDVELPGTAGAAGDNFVACPNDPATCDSFDSGALVNVGIVGSDELFGVTLNGPTVIKRSAVVGGALDSVQTEIIQLDLAGTSTELGDIQVTLAPQPASTGKITEQENDTGELDFPADSFFDIYFEVELEGTTLHNEEPLHLECKIEQIPPELCAYEPPIPEPIQLFNTDGVKIAFIDHAMHIPLPPNGRLVVFENEFKDEPGKKYSIRALKLDVETGDPIDNWEINLYDGGCDDFFASEIDFGFTDADGYVVFTNLQPGFYSVEEKFDPFWNPVTPPCVDVELPGTAGAAGGGFIACPNPDATSCDSFDSGALVNVRLAGDDELFPVTLNGPTVIKRGALIPGATDKIETEILQLDLVGSSPVLGDITLRVSSEALSLGEIEEQDNVTGELDFPADSFFDIFFEVEVSGIILHNQNPLHLECKIDEIPPELCAYEPPIPDPIPLYDDDKNLIAFIEHAMHIPLPPNERLVVFNNEFKDGGCIDPAPGGGALSFEGEGTPNHTAAEQGELCPEESDSWTFEATLFGGLEQFIGIRVVEKTGSINVSVLRPDGTTVNLTPGAELRASHDQENAQYKVTVTGKGPGLATYGIHVCRGIGFCDFAKDITLTPTLLPPTMVPTDTPTPGGSGDANKNGVVNAIDAALVLQGVAGLTDPWPNTDVNGDGATNSIDAALILQFVAGLVPSLPV